VFEDDAVTSMVLIEGGVVHGLGMRCRNLRIEMGVGIKSNGRVITR